MIANRNYFFKETKQNNKIYSNIDKSGNFINSFASRDKISICPNYSIYNNSKANLEYPKDTISFSES